MVNSVALLEETKIFRVHKTSRLKLLSMVLACGIGHDGLSVTTLLKKKAATSLFQMTNWFQWVELCLIFCHVMQWHINLNVAKFPNNYLGHWRRWTWSTWRTKKKNGQVTLQIQVVCAVLWMTVCIAEFRSVWRVLPSRSMSKHYSHKKVHERHALWYSAETCIVKSSLEYVYAVEYSMELMDVMITDTREYT